jgi:hypothetical protein
VIRDPADVLLNIEQECLAADKAIARRAWADCERSWIAQRRLTHELEHALRTVERGSPEFVVAMKRVERIRTFRDKQLERLKVFHANVGKRLTAVNRYRGFKRGYPGAERASVLIDTNR